MKNLIENHLILLTGVTMILDGILVSEPFYVEHLYKWHCHLKAVDRDFRKEKQRLYIWIAACYMSFEHVYECVF